MGDLIDQRCTVVRTLSARDLNESPDFAGPEFQTMRILAAIVGAGSEAYDFPYARGGGGSRGRVPARNRRQGGHRQGGRSVALCHGRRRQRLRLRRPRRCQRAALQGRPPRRRGAGRQPQVPGLLLLRPPPPHGRTRLRAPAGRRQARSTPSTPSPRCRRSWASATRASTAASCCGSTTPTTRRCGRPGGRSTTGRCSRPRGPRGRNSGSGSAGPSTPSTAPTRWCRPSPTASPRRGSSTSEGSPSSRS